MSRALPFDDDAARRLATAARDADAALRDVGILRKGAVQTAAKDFSGRYSELFRDACSVESANRVALAGVLDSLASQVEQARAKADEERTRRTQLEAWKIRDAERRRRHESGDWGGSLGATVDSMFDPSPSTYPVAPPTVSASFTAHHRTRNARGSSKGRTSADPDDLRVFVSQARAGDGTIELHLSRVRNAWATFTSSCAWVPIGSGTFVAGFERLLTENRADATWIENVAAAFDAAGGGKLTDPALDLSWLVDQPTSDQELLDALTSLPADDLVALIGSSPGLQAQLQRMNPVAIHAWWHQMSSAVTAVPPTLSDRQELLLESLPGLFGNLEGIPYGVRDQANRIALEAAIANHEAQLASMRALFDSTTSTTGGYTPGIAEFRKSFYDLEAQLAALKNIQTAARSREGEVARFLISLTDDAPPLAAVSIGDLDTATSVTYAVPGMGTYSSDMTGWTRAAQNLHRLLQADSAVVAWIGYETPPVPIQQSADLGVFDVTRAVAGGHALASALRGLAAVRGDDLPSLNIVAHSYGSTTATVALTQPDIRVATFVTLGSAGLPNSVDHASDLHADQVFSGHARDAAPLDPEDGDPWAWIGRDNSTDHRIDPIKPGFDAQAMGTDTGGSAGKPVTVHDPITPDDDAENGYLDRDTESLQNVAWALTGETDKVTDYTPKGPTVLLGVMGSAGRYG